VPQATKFKITNLESELVRIDQVFTAVTEEEVPELKKLLD
jgi:hypothetical protein